jgi:hypothetical protein
MNKKEKQDVERYLSNVHSVLEACTNWIDCGDTSKNRERLVKSMQRFLNENYGLLKGLARKS